MGMVMVLAMMNAVVGADFPMLVVVVRPLRVGMGVFAAATAAVAIAVPGIRTGGNRERERARHEDGEGHCQPFFHKTPLFMDCLFLKWELSCIIIPKIGIVKHLVSVFDTFLAENDEKLLYGKIEGAHFGEREDAKGHQCRPPHLEAAADEVENGL